MENASRALLIAGGILLTMMVVMLLVFLGGKISELRENENQLRYIEDVNQFNNQFVNYEREVYGYELISLSNKVADYNFRFSNDEDAKNNEKYKTFSLVINMDSNIVKENLSYSNTPEVFTRTNYNTTSTSNGFNSIMSRFVTYEDNYGKKNLVNLSKNIQTLFKDNDATTDEKLEAIRRFQSITNSSYAKENYKTKIDSINRFRDYYDESRINTMYNNYLQRDFKNVCLEYYEYVQFKKAKFECKNIVYDNDNNGTGRIIKMEFELTDKLG